MSNRVAKKLARAQAGQQAPAGAPTGTMEGNLPVRITTISLRELQYREVQVDRSKLRLTDPRMSVDLDMQGQIRFIDAHHAELRIRAAVKPDAFVTPIEVFVAMSAVFERQPTIGPRAFAQFVNDAGPRILFPYIREAISTITNRGVFGALHLDPVAISPMLSAEQLSQIPEKD
jgi:preprotein translocase subunit SecB